MAYTAKDGEQFWYKATDTEALGTMLQPTQTTYAKRVLENILQPAGITHPAITGQNRRSDGHAAGNIRLVMDDWIRFFV